MLNLPLSASSLNIWLLVMLIAEFRAGRVSPATVQARFCGLRSEYPSGLALLQAPFDIGQVTPAHDQIFVITRGAVAKHDLRSPVAGFSQ